MFLQLTFTSGKFLTKKQAELESFEKQSMFCSDLAQERSNIDNAIQIV